jgi:hypothetical protein
MHSVNSFNNNNGTINIHTPPPPVPGPKPWLKFVLRGAGIVVTILLEHAVEGLLP